MHRGEILAIIGPNGAGKTSLFNSLTGVYTPQRGSITVAAREGDEPTSVIYEHGLIVKKTRSRKTHVINHLGVARTFQNIRLFPALTALENVKVGVETRMKSGPVGAMLGLPRQRREEREATERSVELLRFVGLTHRVNELAGSLAYGEQRRLEIARALGTEPGVILLDEPAAGTNPVEKRELADLIRKINEVDGISVLLIEHDMKLVMSVAHRLVVLTSASRSPRARPSRSSATRPWWPPTSAPPTTTSRRRHRPSRRPVRPPGVSHEPARGRRHRGAVRRHPRPQGRLVRGNEGEVVALLGANGAGKTTTQKTVSGMMRPALGEIRFDGDRIDGLPAHHLIHRGICHVPEGRRVFPRMTVAENLDMGAFRFKRADPETLARVYELFPRLKERIAQNAGTLSGGEQQMLAIGRALMGKPRLLLLDEPSMGLAPLVVRQIFDIVREINSQGVTVLIVEQNAAQALALATRGYVLETGEIVLSGSGKELLADDRIRAAYLGEEIAT